MNNTLYTKKTSYHGLKSSIFLCYYIALMPIITTIIKFITSLFSNSLSVFGLLTGQFYILILAVPIIFMAFDLYSIIMGNIKHSSFKETLKNYPELFILAGFLLWCTLATVLQIIIFKNTQALNFAIGTYYITEGLPLFIYYGMCLAAAFLIKDRKTAKNLLFIVVSTSVLLCICSLIDPQKYYLGNNTYSTTWAGLFLNSNHYGYYLAMCIMLSSSIFSIAKEKWLEILTLFATLLLAIVMMFNDTFGSLLTTFGCLILMPILISLFKNKFRWKYLVPLAIFIIVSIVTTPIAKHYYSTYYSFFGQIYNLIKELFVIAEAPVSEAAKQAGTSRWDLWLHAFSEISSSPLIGNGDIMYRPHNEYLQYAMVWGIPSVLIYLTALAFIFIKALKNLKHLSNITIVLLFGVLGYITSAFFGNTMPHVMPLFMLILGMLIRNLGDDIKNRNTSPNITNFTANNNIDNKLS